ncbi:unnamed protein product [Boreogadus saida]
MGSSSPYVRSVLMTLREGGLGARSDLMVELLTLMYRTEQAGESVGFIVSDSRFIQVIAKSLSIGCKEELEAIRDAPAPPLASAGAKIGDMEALESIREMASNTEINA